MKNTTHTLHEASAASTVLAEVVGYAAALLFFVGASALFAWVWLKRTRAASLPHLVQRMTVYALLLSCLWPVVTLNRFDVLVPDGRLVPVALVALNALAWAVALTELVGWFMGYDGNPPHWNSYDLVVLALRTVVATLALVSLSSEAARFVALLMVVPMGAVFVWVAVEYSTEARQLTIPHSVHWGTPWAEWMKPQHVVAGALVPVGLATLILEMLTPSYGNVVGHGMAALFMFAEHVALAAILLVVCNPSANLQRKTSNVAETDTDISARVASMDFPLPTTHAGSSQLLDGFDDD